MNNQLHISFIGGGNMAAALISGLISKVTEGANLHVVDLNLGALQNLQQRFGVSSATEIDATIGRSEVIVLAVKPQQMREVVATLRLHVTNQLVLSIAAGIRSIDLVRWLGGHEAIVRCMPNTPALIGQGITCMFASAGVTTQQRETADVILRTVGSTVWLNDERNIDVVTAISGSGPAYVFYFIEAMQQAAQELGLTAQQGIELAKATFSGAAQLAIQSVEPVSLLRERVTSKGGTTHAALTSMEASSVKALIITAIKAAAKRGRELGDEFGRD